MKVKYITELINDNDNAVFIVRDKDSNDRGYVRIFPYDYSYDDKIVEKITTFMDRIILHIL